MTNNRDTGGTKTPKKLYRSSISDGALRVWIEIASHSDNCNPSIPTIAKHTNKPVRTVIRNLDELVKLGHLIIHKTPGKRNSYIVASCDGPWHGK